jgi:hypothetical protein
MDALELQIKHVKALLKKAYEYRAKINKRNNRLYFFKTQHAIRRFKRFLKSQAPIFTPNKNEILLTMAWFLRCPSQNDNEKLVFTLVSLIYKLHKFKLSNLR